MDKSKIIRAMDLAVFLLIILCTALFFWDKTVSRKIDGIFLPEERNKAYYDILNDPEKWYENKELAENGTRNLLANYLISGDRDSGYSITVNTDGTFIFSGNYIGENNAYEAITPRGIGIDLPSGDYLLTDGGASLEDNVSVRLTGAKRMIGGSTEYVTIASLPGNGLFHWDKDPNLEIYCEIVICPGASVDNLKFSPMLLRADDAVGREYEPCLAARFDWEENKTADGVQFYKYDIYRGTLDGELISADDWRIFSNTLSHQMQVDRAVIDLKDGYGIEIMKKDFPMSTYGKLNVSMTVSEGQTIDITDFDEVVKVVNSRTGLDASQGVHHAEAPDVSELKNIRDFYSYLKALYNEDYIVLLSVRDDGVSALNRESMELLHRLGVETTLADHEAKNINSRKFFQNSFYSLLRHGNAEAEKVGDEKLTVSGELPDGVEYIIDSAGQKTEESNASIIIGGNECSMNQRGMNFVVYDEKQHRVVDSVCFDTFSGLLCHRQPESD